MNIQQRLQCSSLLDVHNRLMLCHESGQKEISKLDELLIKKNHKFLWEDTKNELTWEEELAKKYYDKLFKEYCICDLSKYKENRVALRWRTKTEVISGRGQFSCAEKKCNCKERLKTWEVNFCYLENNEKKNALVKIKLCSECSAKLNYHSLKREVKRLKKKGKSKNRFVKEQNVETGVTKNLDEKVEEKPTGSNMAEESQNPWSQKIDIEIKSREEEMDEYLDELLF
ncbi:protein FRA10AC1 [Coccinella septempunctata]|uniref:protein FRA10AC1 n=1 Tax=Coccinella septempunctata TaxID=41139 RepID=UPI001D0874B9|nr:protein FRA10AC1 [Coccinella septempunctata]